MKRKLPPVYNLPSRYVALYYYDTNRTVMAIFRALGFAQFIHIVTAMYKRP